MQKQFVKIPATDRVGRYPKHNFTIQIAPYTAQPFLIAPVLPGETLENLYMEARAVSDPIANPITGWKKEYYYFYVKITDLLSDTIRDMFIDPANVDIAATLGAAARSQAYYSAKGGVNYAEMCLKSIWQHWFADEGDVWANSVLSGYNASVDGVPRVQIKDRLWLDSITDEDAISAAVPPDGTQSTNYDALMDAFEHLRTLGIAGMSYEDFLRSYGIAVPDKELDNKPELLHQFKEFTYPSNTINPADGTPSTAMSWVFKNSARDPKRFTEPGFVIGVTVVRPKLFFTGLSGSLSSHLTRAWDWLPNYLNDVPDMPGSVTSMKHFLTDTGPLGDRLTATDGYFVDMRDLFTKGDQFSNRWSYEGAAPANVGNINGMALPPGDNHHDYKYPSAAQITSLFTGANKLVREDGYVSLNIKGRVRDTLGSGPVSA